jgi:nickel/cobalt exporter
VPVISRPVMRLTLAALMLASAVAAAHATASPFGVGLPEPAPTGGGLLPSLFQTIAAWQSSFYRDLTATIRAMKTDGTAGFWLITASFLYGVLHAAGPGHGKAIVSAYVLANRETARNGAFLALVSALAQGVTAVALVSVAAIILGATSMAMTRAAELFEIGSFALVTGLGIWLVWRKIVRPLADGYAARFAPIVVGGPSLQRAGKPHSHAGHSHGHEHHDHHAHHHAPHAHDHTHGAIICEHGHVHAAGPSLAAGPLNWSKAWTTIAAVGLRPCTGALIVLVFALSQGLFIAGVAATFAMALGTGLTVAALTLGAVSARSLAVKLSGGGETAHAHRVHTGVEALGAVLVLLFGLVMLGASVSG